MPPSLVAPELGILAENGVVDDVFMEALAATAGVPFIVPFYADVAAGDKIILMGNGRPIGYHEVTENEKNLLQPFTIYAAKSAFQFTGKLDIYYYVEDVQTLNRAVSSHLLLRVQRNGYSQPYDGGDEGLPAPVVSPAVYPQSAFDRGQQVSVSVGYPGMQAGDTVQIFIEMRALTLDRNVNYYYPDPSPPARDVTAPVPSNKQTMFTLPAGAFRGVDECACRVFYAVYSVEKPWLQKRSLSTRFQIDVVPPFE